MIQESASHLAGVFFVLHRFSAMKDFGRCQLQGILGKIYRIGVRMRMFICGVSALVTVLFTGCGQTGALQLPSDPNYDKRAKYLLHTNTDQAAVQIPQNATEATAKPVSE